MALANYSLPFAGAIAPPTHWSATINPLQQHATAVNNLLYGPAGHQADTDGQPEAYYKNDPYAPPPPPPQSGRQQYRGRNNNYLPPPPPSPSLQQQPQFNGRPQQQQQQQFSVQSTRTYGEQSYANVPQRNVKTQQEFVQQPPQQQQQYFNNFNRASAAATGVGSSSYTTPEPPALGSIAPQSPPRIAAAAYPQQATSFTRVQAGTGSHTQVHAVLDYDDNGTEDEEYYDDEDGKFFFFLIFDYTKKKTVI